jgi:hypothetical protein
MTFGVLVSRTDKYRFRVATAGCFRRRSSMGTPAGRGSCAGRRSTEQRGRSGRAATSGSWWVAEHASRFPGPGSRFLSTCRRGYPTAMTRHPGSNSGRAVPSEPSAQRGTTRMSRPSPSCRSPGVVFTLTGMASHDPDRAGDHYTGGRGVGRRWRWNLSRARW